MSIKYSYITAEGVPDLFNKKNCLFVIGNKDQLQSAVYEAKNLLTEKEFEYEIYIHNSIGKTSFADYIGGDVICPLFDIKGYNRGYIVADSS